MSKISLADGDTDEPSRRKTIANNLPCSTSRYTHLLFILFSTALNFYFIFKLVFLGLLLTIATSAAAPTADQVAQEGRYGKTGRSDVKGKTI